MKFHHLGLLTKNPEKAIIFLTHLKYKVGPRIFDSEQNASLYFCTSRNMPNIELIVPAENNQKLQKLFVNFDDLIYHTCYITPSIDKTLQSLKAKGISLITVVKPVPAVLFGGKKVSFYYASGIGLIELLEQA